MSRFQVVVYVALPQVWVWSPVEMVKLRLQLQAAPRGSPGYVGPLAMTRQIWAREGVRGALGTGGSDTHCGDF